MQKILAFIKYLKKKIFMKQANHFKLKIFSVQTKLQILLTNISEIHLHLNL